MSYEADEMRVVIGTKDKQNWLSYVLCRETNKVQSFVVGARNTENLKGIIDTTLKLNPKSINTDKLSIYQTIIPSKIHIVFKRCTNKIERFNLTLRTHLKRLFRKTICYSKTQRMLEVSLILYFYG